MTEIHVIPPPAGEIVNSQGVYERVTEPHTVQTEQQKRQAEFEAAKKALIALGALPKDTALADAVGATNEDLEVVPSGRPAKTNKQYPFDTFFGPMTALEFAIYRASLTPLPAKRGYVTLSCGHKFTTTRPPKGGCTTCWNAFYASNPAEIVGMKQLLDEGRERDLLSQFGAERVKQAKRVLRDGIREDEIGTVAA